MSIITLIIFGLVYFGMIVGNLPGLAIDRAGVALLGAILFISFSQQPLSEAIQYVDLSTIGILFSFMVISAQFYFSGFYTHLVQKLICWHLTPSQLLFAIIFTSGLLSSVLLNDIVCLALTPLMIQACRKKSLNPHPYLLGLACSANIGSSLTLIGNPQNVLIGEALNIRFGQYMKFSSVPCLLGLFFTWGLLHLQFKKQWHSKEASIEIEAMQYNSWQSLKGMLIICVLILSFFFAPLPRDHLSLIAAGCILLSRRISSYKTLNFIDWQLLVLFIGLFIVSKGFLQNNDLEQVIRFLQNANIDMQSPVWMFILSIFLSNTVSNVPAVMLLLPFTHSQSMGSLLAISSTLAGNMLIIGSIANIIVISQALNHGVKISWRKHLKTGLPLTLITLLISALWLFILS